MTSLKLSVRRDVLDVTWSDGSTAHYPTIWLRDNCPSGLHPQTQERLSDLLELEECPTLVSATLDGDAAVLGYQDGHVSRLPLALLNAFRPGQRAEDPGVIPPTLWRSDVPLDAITGHSAAGILAEDAGLADWMRDTAIYGLSIVQGLEDRADAGIELAEKIGFLRQTNFGTTFEVVNKPDPNNLAYTAVALPLHTDLPNQEVPPGYQFLHCRANEAVGGGSVFADGFAMAQDLRLEDPEAFDLLCDIAVPFRFHDGDVDIRGRHPVIDIDADGSLVEIRYNAHIAGVFDMDPSIMPAYYRAYRAFMTKTRDLKYRLMLKLKAGEMVAFDNRRVLHGREAFDPTTGYRHLHGCYVDRGEFTSRLRRLAAAKGI